MITEHHADAWLVQSGMDIRLTGGTITLDEGWAPYVQATITSDDRLVTDFVDPRDGTRVGLHIGRTFVNSRPLAAVSAAWQGLRLSHLAGRYPTLSALSAEFSEPYNAGDVRPADTRDLDLTLVSVEILHSTGQVTMTLVSDELLLQDTARVATTPISPSTAVVRSCVLLALASIGATLTSWPLTDTSVAADAIAWTPGVSAWDYAAPIVDAAGLRLYCDEQRRWHLTTPGNGASGGIALTAENVIEFESSTTRSDDYYDSVVVIYSWRDAAGVDQVRYDVAGPATPTRTLTIEYARPWIANGAAKAILARASGRGRVIHATLPTRYDVTPGHALIADLPATSTTQTAVITSATFDLETCEMTLRSRDATDTPSTAWLFTPPGITWTTVTPGITWATYSYSF